MCRPFACVSGRTVGVVHLEALELLSKEYAAKVCHSSVVPYSALVHGVVYTNFPYSILVHGVVPTSRTLYWCMAWYQLPVLCIGAWRGTNFLYSVVVYGVVPTS